MPLRVAVFACPCCDGSSSMPLGPGERPPARRACPNGGCWSCLGVCRGRAERTEVLRMRADPALADPELPAMTRRPLGMTA